ncbi:MAG: hypothetical protein HGA54_06585 [Actinobacteria bacterium]|nr:hypothetical protein [Actinomycetota bacterium]
MEPILVLEQVSIKDGSLEAIVACDPQRFRVPEEVAERIRSLLPDIDGQVCISPGHECFGEELVGTETPHLLEHVTIELLVQETRVGDNREAVFTGHTSFVDEEEGGLLGDKKRMRVNVAFDNDFVALKALREACDIIEWAFAGNLPSPSIMRISRELQALRKN